MVSRLHLYAVFSGGVFDAPRPARDAASALPRGGPGRSVQGEVVIGSQDEPATGTWVSDSHAVLDGTTPYGDACHATVDVILARMRKAPHLRWLLRDHGNVDEPDWILRRLWSLKTKSWSGRSRKRRLIPLRSTSNGRT